MYRNSTKVNELRFSNPRRLSTSNFDKMSLSQRSQRLSLPVHSRSRTHPIVISPFIQEYDVLYENQRGFYLLGIPKFSANLLSPLDPPAWCDRNLKGIGTDLQNHPLPDPTWEWVDSTWLVDMSGDVDPNGWQYAFRFNNCTWRGDSKAFHNFVRRRRWLRLRQKKVRSPEVFDIVPLPDTSPLSDSAPLSPISMKSEISHSSDTSSLEPISVSIEGSNITQRLGTSRVDREKIAIIQTMIELRETPFSEDEIADVLNCLEFETNRQKLQRLFDEHSAQFAPPPSSTPKIEIINSSEAKVDQLQEYFQDSSDLLLQTRAFSPSINQGTTPSLYLDARSYVE